MNSLSMIGRDSALFYSDIATQENSLKNRVHESRILVIGGAGTIGQAVSKEIFKRDPKALHIVDISENNMVELVRDLRSTVGYGSGDFKLLRLIAGLLNSKLLWRRGPYDTCLICQP